MATRLPRPGPANIPPAISSEIEGAPGAAPSSRPNPAAAAELGDTLRAEIAAEMEAEGFGRAKGHNFWTRPLNTYDPKTQFRFMIEIPGMGLEDARREGQENQNGDAFADEGVDNMLWYVKSCDKPGYNLKNLTEGHYSSDAVPAEPQVLTTSPNFKSISMTFVDPVYPNVTRKLARILRRGGFQENLAYNIAERRGGGTKSYIDTIEYVKIHQLDAQGRFIETWTLVDAYPIEVDWGKLDYSSNDLVEISVTWGFKTFKVEFPAIGNELAYEYFSEPNFQPPIIEQGDPTDDEWEDNNPK